VQLDLEDTFRNFEQAAVLQRRKRQLLTLDFDQIQSQKKYRFDGSTKGAAIGGS
jgi:hypothetical protein